MEERENENVNTENKNTNNSNNTNNVCTEQRREQYLEELKAWLEQARIWQNTSSGFPYFYAEVTRNQEANGQDEQQSQNTYTSLAQAHMWHQNVENIMRQRHVPANNSDNNVNENLQQPADANIPFYQTYPFTLPATTSPPTSFEFIIAPIWKRLIAEFVDFTILFTVKLALTFILMESFNFINTDMYRLDAFQKNLENPELAYPIAVELLTLEFLHRLIVCAWETYFLRGNFCATPGKRFMGLMVITVETFTAVPGRTVETISATGARPLGWQKSLIRSMLKNFIVGLVLPLFVTFYIYPYNRTSYDMMANTVVVENHPEFLMYHATG